MRRWLLVALFAGACATPSHPTAQPPATPQATLGSSLTEDSLELHFRALAAALEGEGLVRGALAERGFLPPAGRVAYPVHIAAAECALFVAVATASMADLDASLYTAEGTALIEDDSTSSRPSLTFCASAAAPVDAYLTLHAYQGAGSFVAAQFTRAPRDGDDLRTAQDGQRVTALAQLAQTLHERGFEDAAPRVSLPLGDARPVRMAVNVAAGECYTLAAEGGDGLAEVGLRLVDGEGGELAHGLGEPTTGKPQLAALQYCASERAELALEVVAMRGQGIARIARFRATQALVGGARALWLGEPTPSQAAWPSAKTKSGPQIPTAAPPKQPFASEQITLSQGQLLELAPRRAHGRCERWHALLLPGLSAVTLRIESEQGELLAEAESEHMQACIVLCGDNRPRRISLVGQTGFGALQLTGTLADETSSQDSPDAARCPVCAEADARTRCSMSSGRR